MIDYELALLAKQIADERPSAFKIRLMIEQYISVDGENLASMKHSIIELAEELQLIHAKYSKDSHIFSSIIHELAIKGNLQEIIELTEPVILASPAPLTGTGY